MNKRSQIKNRVNEVIEKFGEGVAMTDKILAQLDKNKALVSANIDDMLTRAEELETTLEMTDDLVESTSEFADKANRIKHAKMWKNLKMTIALVAVSGGAVGFLGYQLGLY